jgi:hypothetical protein
MKRVLSLLLIALLMLGHLLPHSHVGTGADQPGDPAARPHIHLASHDSHHGHSHDSHHGHSHDHAQATDDHDHGDSIRHGTDTASNTLGISSLSDHDSDAIYFASSRLAYDRPSRIDSPDSDLIAVVAELSIDFNSLPTHLICTIPLRRSLSLPLYLLTASLRL